MSVDKVAERKWHRKTSEEKLRLAVFAAMRESCASPVSPTEIGLRAGLTKSLIYKYFGSVDVLIDEAIQRHLIFPVPSKVVVKSAGEEDLPAAIAATWANILKVLRSHPEILDVLAWSVGSPSDRARRVVERYRQFCVEVASELGTEVYLATTFFGLTILEICERLPKDRRNGSSGNKTK